MAINDGFLSAITDALINKVNEPSKLDDVASKVQDIVSGLDKSAKTFNRLSGLMSKTFKEAVTQYRQHPSVAGKTQLTAQDLTQIYNKLAKPLHTAMAQLVKENSKLNLNFHRQLSATRDFERESTNRLARLQSKLESSERKAAGAPKQVADPSSFHTQLNRAYAEIAKSRVETKAIQQTREQQLLAIIRSEAREMRNELRGKLAEAGRSEWSRPQVTGYRRVSTPELSRLEGPTDIYLRSQIRAISEGTTARARRPATSTDYGIKKGSGQSPETTPGLLGAAAITIDKNIGVINEFLRNIKPALTNATQAMTLLTAYSQQRQYQERLQASRGKGLQSRETIRLGEGVLMATMAGVNTRIQNESLPGFREQMRYNRTRANYLQDPARLQKWATIDQMLSQPWAQPPKKSVYIAGPMRGIPELNFPAFDKAEADWRKRGFGVVNPAQMDREHGYVPTKQQTVFKDLSIQQAMSRDLPAVAGTHAIALLKGWEKSQGAKMELQHAIERRKEIYDAETGERLRLKDVASGLGTETLKKAVAERLPVRELRKEPTTIYREPEIEAFVAKHKFAPTPEAIRPAAQMAASVGMQGRRFFDLTNIMLASQAEGRKVAAANTIREQEVQRKRLTSGERQEPSKFREVASEASKGLSSLRGERGSITLESLFPWLGKKAQTKASDASYEQRAMGPIPEPTDLRGSMRRDVLESKLRRLAEAAEAATKAFQHYRDEIAPQKIRQAQLKYGEREFAITRGLAGTNLSLDAQVDRIEARRAKIQASVPRRTAALESSFEERTQSLGFSELDARFALDVAKQRREREAKRLTRLRDKSGKKLYTEEQVQQMVAPITQRAEMRHLRTQYEKESAQLGVVPGAVGPYSDLRLRGLRERTAEAYAVARYGPGKHLEEARTSYSQEVLGLLGGRTPIQKVAQKETEIKEDAASKETELDNQVSRIRQRRQMADEKAAQQRTVAQAKYGEAATKVEDEVAKKAEAASGKRVAAERKSFEARVSYLKKEDLVAGRGERGGGVGGGGGGRGGGGGSRSGYGFGIGLSSLVAFDVAVKELIKDATVYAARTEMMEFSTAQMAKVSGLSAQEVNAEVEALKHLNITTQAAHQTVQRLMMMQLDLAKATKLVSVAQDLAAVSGADAMETVTRLSQAVLTGYTRNLHMMGLQVTSIGVMRELKAQRRAEGKTGEPSMMEQRQALVNRIILEGAKVAGTYERSLSTAGGQFAYLRKEIQETSNVLGKEFLPSFTQLTLLLNSGLKFAQAHGEAMGFIAKGLVSIGVAASTLTSIAFIRWLISAGTKVGGPAGFAVSAIAGLATGAILNRSKASVDKSVASQQHGLVGDRIEELKKEQAALLKVKDTSAAWQNSWNINAQSLKSYSEQQKQITEDLTTKLAEEYNKRLVDYDEYLKDLAGKNGVLSYLLASSDVVNFLGGAKYRAPKVPFGSKPGAQEEADARAKGEFGRDVAKNLQGGGVSSSDIQKKADQIRKDAEASRLLPTRIINEIRAEVTGVMQSQQAADEVLEKYSKLSQPGGRMMIKALKTLGSPREKAQIDFETAVDEIERSAREDAKYQAFGEEKKVVPGQPGYEKYLQDQKRYEEYIKQTGDRAGGGREAALQAIQRRKDDRAGVEKELALVRDIELGKINAQTKAQILQIEEQTQVERILAGVIKGNYASEEAGIKSVLSLKQKDLELIKKLLPGLVDQHKVTAAQIKAERDQAAIRLNEQKKLDNIEKIRTTRQRASEIQARQALRRPGTAEQELTKAFATRIEAIDLDKNLGDQDKWNKQIQLVIELDDAISKLHLDQQALGAEAEISQFVDQQELLQQVYRITSGRGKTRKERDIEEIEFARTSQRAVAAEQFSRRAAVEPPEGVPRAQRDAELLVARQDAERKADFEAAKATVKLEEQRRNDAIARLHDVYQIRVSDEQRIGELTAVNTAEEQAVAYNTHKARLEFINREFELRKKLGESVEDLERTRMQERHAAEMEYLQVLLQQRRQQIEGLKSLSGNLYDIITSRTPNKQQQAKDYAISLGNNVGRTVFTNIAVELFKGMSGSLGGIFRGQEKTTTTVDPVTGKTTTKTTPTWLGRVLAGTPFGKSPTDKQIEQAKAAVKATEENTVAENELTKAVKDLADAIRRAQGLLPGDKPATGSDVKFDEPKAAPQSTVFDETSIFRGADKEFPGIFHLMPTDKAVGSGSTINDLLNVRLAQVGGVYVQTAVPVFVVNGLKQEAAPSTVVVNTAPQQQQNSGMAASIGALAGVVAAGGGPGGGGGGGGEEAFVPKASPVVVAPVVPKVSVEIAAPKKSVLLPRPMAISPALSLGDSGVPSFRQSFAVATKTPPPTPTPVVEPPSPVGTTLLPLAPPKAADTAVQIVPVNIAQVGGNAVGNSTTSSSPFSGLLGGLGGLGGGGLLTSLLGKFLPGGFGNLFSGIGSGQGFLSSLLNLGTSGTPTNLGIPSFTQSFAVAAKTPPPVKTSDVPDTVPSSAVVGTFPPATGLTAPSVGPLPPVGKAAPTTLGSTNPADAAAQIVPVDVVQVGGKPVGSSSSSPLSGLLGGLGGGIIPSLLGKLLPGGFGNLFSGIGSGQGLLGSFLDSGSSGTSSGGLGGSLGIPSLGGSSTGQSSGLGSLFSVPSFGGSGSMSGTLTTNALVSAFSGMKTQAAPSVLNSPMVFSDQPVSAAAPESVPPVTGAGSPGSTGTGGTWPGTNIPIPDSGGGQLPPSVDPTGGGGGGATTAGAAAGKANYLGGAVLIGTGGYQAYQGFSKGGAKGIASGVGGVLMTGAGVAMMVPGGQLVAGVLAGAALVSDLIGQMLGDSRQQRAIDIQKYLDKGKYIAPTQLSREMDVQGNLVSVSARGGLSRDTGIKAFPISFTPTQYGKTPSKTWADPNIPEYYTIPGQINYGGLGTTPNPMPVPVPPPVGTPPVPRFPGGPRGPLSTGFASQSIDPFKDPAGPMSVLPKAKDPFQDPLDLATLPFSPLRSLVDKVQLQANPPEYGRETINMGSSAQNMRPITYNINLPIHAMDSKDVIARSPDIAAALKKEIQGGNDIGVEMKKAVFGAGMVG